MTTTAASHDDADEAARLQEWKRKRESRKRQRQQQAEEKSPWNDNDLGEDEDDDGVVPANRAIQLKRERQDLLLESTKGRKVGGQRRKQALEALDPSSTAVRNQPDDNDKQVEENDAAGANANDDENTESLLDQVAALQKTLTVEERAQVARSAEESRILAEASQVQTNALQAASEVADGVTYKTPMPSSWKPPRFILDQGETGWNKVRQAWHMEIQGSKVPPPITRFQDLKLPKPILDMLQQKGISKPTPIQIQGIPVALAGRDMVGIAFTGSGKTLTFSLPMVMAALEEELRMPLQPGEGPIGIIMAPSRELARQTLELVQDLCKALEQAGPPYPRLRSQLLIGGESARDQVQPFQQQGVHCVVATPGRLRDLLKRKNIYLSNTRFMCLDEADRMLDMGFDEEVGEIMNYFPRQRQTLLFSATFPKKFQDFARQTLVQPIVVNVGRAGAANLDVIQEVEYVKEEAKIVYLLHCLQKTAPPVIIFCQRKGAADDIHEYLLLKGVQAVSIHGGKDQEERNEAIRLFKQGEKDVLIATDIAAKGLDFPAIQHVINFDMPDEIENYVHRIGRTGRAGKTGVATTYINKSSDETVLLDLKALLQEAKQRIPPVLEMLEDPRAKNNGVGCAFCGGLGHSIVDCPKIDKDARRVAGSHRDVLTGGGDW